MCKHVAAVLYGVGARLDQEPELLFTLRQVDHGELISQASAAAPSAAARRRPAAPWRRRTGRPVRHRARRGEGDADAGDAAGAADQAPPAPPKRGARPARRKAAARARKAPAARPAAARASSAPRWRRGRTVTARELVARGVPHAVFQAWFRAGHLERTGQRGVYRTTASTEGRIAAYLER